MHILPEIKERLLSTSVSQKKKSNLVTWTLFGWSPFQGHRTSGPSSWWDTINNWIGWMGWDSANLLPRKRTRPSSVGHVTMDILSKRVKIKKFFFPVLSWQKKKDDFYRSRGRLKISSFLYLFITGNLNPMQTAAAVTLSSATGDETRNI